MMELAKMSRKERTLISVQCDKFFLTINKYKDAKPVFDTLKDSLNLPTRYDKEIWCVVTCVAKSLRAGNNGSQFPLKEKVYTSANNVHGLGLNNKRASLVVKLLDEKGWLTFYKGFKDVKNPDNKMRSCLIFSDDLKALFSANLLARYARPITETEMVEVKDSKTKQSFMKLTRFKGVSSHRNFMVNYNKLLSESEITIAGVQCAVTYKQVFADDLDGGGRFYTFGKFQTAQSELRRFIKINGNHTTEVDVRGIHPAICRTLQGGNPLKESFDPYGIDNTYNINNQEFRLLCKFAVMCMINCKTKVGASKALTNIVQDDFKKNYEDRDFTSVVCFDNKISIGIINKLILHNSPVNFFGKDQLTWQELQRYDSKVSEGVMKRFIKNKIPVLCYHDSWVCEVQHRDFLIESIKESWYDVFSTNDNCFLKIEF